MDNKKRNKQECEGMNEVMNLVKNDKKVGAKEKRSTTNKKQ